MFDLSDLALFFLFGVFVALWWNAQGVKQIALKATQDYCQSMGVQLLDDGVVLRGFWLRRNAAGKLCLWRSYNFEFTSTGEQRYSGQIVLLGRIVEAVHLDPHRLN
ncbi:MAG: DUF3301 domain-containing protein [Spongiibacteraceae bacterium]